MNTDKTNQKKISGSSNNDDNSNSSNSNVSSEQLYRRLLPESCISFSSDVGKRLFTESLLSGFANIYFPLAEQFRTQDEPAYNGLSTLVMVLNALAVDPKRIWRGPWRWYYEDMLGCCLPQDLKQQKGTTMDQFVRLAVCNNLDLNVMLAREDASEEDFRRTVQHTCSKDDKVLICCYSRRVLGQSGHGHFTPIGAYHPSEDLVLVLDVERYKYPPHWVPLSDMWKAMGAPEKTTGSPRGYIVMRKTLESPLLLFRLSTTFRVTIATHNLSNSPMAQFVKSWNDFLTRDHNKNCHQISDTLDDIITHALQDLQEALAVFVEGESVLATQFETCCDADLPPEFVDRVKSLLSDLEETSLFLVVDSWVQTYKERSITNNVRCPKLKVCPRRICGRLKKMGKVVETIDIEDASGGGGTEAGGCKKTQKTECTKDNRSTSSKCSKGERNGKQLVHESHYISMLLMSWPYENDTMSAYVTKLNGYISGITVQLTDLLQNEVGQLKQQIISLASMVNQ